MITETKTVRPARPRNMDAWTNFRRQMPAARHWAYFDHAAVAPLSAPAGESLAAWTRDNVENGDVHWPFWARRLEHVRRQCANLIGAELEETALVRNTTEGINLVAEGYPWQAGDNVVAPADEFPSNRIPWQNLGSRGVEARLVPCDGTDADYDRLAAACDGRTRILAVSWVGYATGRRFDVAKLAELAHSRGSLLFLDAIQGLGVFPLDVHASGVDFLAADGHKWLLGPEGAGLFYVRRELLDRLRPIGLGWNSVVGEHDFSQSQWRLKPSAARYEGGTMNTGGLLALGASLALLAQHGTAAIGQRVLEISSLACERLAQIGVVIRSDRNPRSASGIVAFEVPGKSSTAVRRDLQKAGVAVSCRAGRLRISPHAYNNADDVGRLIEAIRASEGRG